MLTNQRMDKILELFKEDGSAKVINLARIFEVSEVTIRQDLEKLEFDGFIRREHGGAFLKNVEASVKSFTLITKDNLEKKKTIGKKAEEIIESGDSIILDSGSTTTEIAKNLIIRSGLTVISNALNIALLFILLLSPTTCKYSGDLTSN